MREKRLAPIQLPGPKTSYRYEIVSLLSVIFCQHFHFRPQQDKNIESRSLQVFHRLFNSVFIDVDALVVD